MRTASISAALAVVALAMFGLNAASGATTACELGLNEIQCENAKPGNPPSEWDIGGGTDPNILGFATDISVNRGESVRFKIKTDASAYAIDIYRLGWYGGLGARKITSIAPSVALPQIQPDCLNDLATGLVDCGNWAESASWEVPSDAVSGVYIAKLTHAATLGESHIVFVVRDDEGSSDVLFQTADTTWQAYNRYGGNSLYFGSPAGRAYKVSYNRPFTTREYANHSWFFGAEYPMVRWLERNGYDVSYFTGVDSDRYGERIRSHRVFLSNGHDEYWSATQRAHVEAARNAGVHLGFFSGNDVFWKTRWEPSIDGSGSSHKTLVSYKETSAGAKIDPDAAWTGTWRDPRFSPPSDGGRPENALTGTLFTVNGYREDAIKVPAEYGGLRLWRNTNIAGLPPGATATLPVGTLGYEWNEDPAEGAASRPPGLVRMSSTTVDVPARLADFGTTYRPAAATHHLTLYRHSSDALVFSAGTVQWSWGLDSSHDYFRGSTPRLEPDARMQQATVNLLADMDAQPTTLQPGLVGASASSDEIAPTSTITSPASGATFVGGTTVTVTGTASDAGGAVGAVEVSVDGGNSWRPAIGRGTWSYTWPAGGIGPVTIKSRAVDDSGNIESAGPGVTIQMTCVCTLWSGAAIPSVQSHIDRNAVEVGVRFRADVAGYVTGVRFFKGSANTGVHAGSLWTNAGALLARATFTGETATGWQEVVFDSPVAVTADTTYVASYHAPSGGYAMDQYYFSGSEYANSPLRAMQDGVSGANGVFRYTATSAFPNQTYRSSNYWVDVVFHTEPPPDTRSPSVVSVVPTGGATGADVRGRVTATFSEAVDPATVGSATFQLRDGAGSLVPSNVTYDPATRTAALTPASRLAYETLYTARIMGGATGVKDPVGNALEADYVWTFTTAAPRPCPCSIWNDMTTPSTHSTDANAVELGVKFRADEDGHLLGLRFYKGPNNTGTHVGSLWTSGGLLLARATFSNESATGWQTVTFDAPVSVVADATYVASYHAPVGRYSITQYAFVAAGVDNPPVRALQDGIDGANGLYRYSATSAFPNQTYRSSNYWVDVIFSRTAPPDTNPPSVASVSPVAGASRASVSSNVTATFSEPVNPATITSGTFELRTSSGVAVPASVAYDGATQTASLDPSAPLEYGRTYTATVRGGAGGVTDVAGNPLAANHVWSFSTPTCPCSIFRTAYPTLVGQTTTDANAVEVGLKFRSDVAGYVTGVLFYKHSGNSGIHVGSLWTSAGALLARGTFSNETATGWQQLLFDGPVAVAANQTYVASYHAPNGRYAVTPSFFASSGYVTSPLEALRSGVDGANGVFKYAATSTFPNQPSSSSNYWVDVLFETQAPGDTTAPRVSTTSPAAAATSVPVDSSISVAFSEPIESTTVAPSTFELRGAAGALVAASVTYDAATRTATLVPTAPLAYSTSYTAAVRGGSAGIRDLAGNALAADHTWTFSTRTCPCSIWNASAKPSKESIADAKAVELGVKFRVDVSGYVTGIRFYKGSTNTGSHVGSLWTTGGTLLARATFVGETASGWQSVLFDSPVPVSAGTTYVASYHAPVGRYSADQNYFASSGTDNPPLRALRNGVEGGNGLFAYSTTPAFPTQTSKSTNYWVDVVFTVSLP